MICKSFGVRTAMVALLVTASTLSYAQQNNVDNKAKASAAQTRTDNYDPARRQRLGVIVRTLQGQLDKLNQQLVKDPKNVTTRDLSNAALLVLQTGGSGLSSELTLRRLFKLQNMDPDSPKYGTFPWKVNDPTVQDANAVDFVLQPMGAILLGYGNRLSDDFKKDTRKNIEASLVGLAGHHVQVSYTNIFLMNTVNTILLSQYLGDEKSLQRGYRQWAEWLDYTSKNGIHEFDSPTYYAVDLGNLVLGYVYIKDPAIHQQVKDVLDYYWRDVTSQYLAKSNHIAGAHSRDYNFLSGRGGMDFFFYIEGLLDSEKFADGFLEKADLLENERPNGYRPSAEILALSKPAERIVEQRWDENPARTKYTYLTQDFAMGTASGNYSPQDKMFAADLTGPQPLVSITLIPDTFDSPYGVLKTRDRSGHNKPTHMPVNLSAVQEKGTALMVLDLNPNGAAKESSFATNLILPATADDLVLDGAAVKVSSSLNKSAQLNSVIGIREGQSCFAARFYQVDPLNGDAPVFALKADDAGLKNGAIRFAVYHSAATVPNPNTNHLHVGVLATVSACSDAQGLAEAVKRLQDAKIDVERNEKTFKASANVGGLQLELTEDLKTRLPIQRKVNGADRAEPIFRLNGNLITLTRSGVAQAAAAK